MQRCHFISRNIFLGQDSTYTNGTTIDKDGSRFLLIKVSKGSRGRRSNDDCSSSVHCHFTPLQVSCRRGLEISAKFLMNLEQNAAELRRLRTSDTLVGGTTF